MRENGKKCIECLSHAINRASTSTALFMSSDVYVRVNIYFLLNISELNSTDKSRFINSRCNDERRFQRMKNIFIYTRLDIIRRHRLSCSQRIPYTHYTYIEHASCSTTDCETVCVVLIWFGSNSVLYFTTHGSFFSGKYLLRYSYRYTNTHEYFSSFWILWKCKWCSVFYMLLLWWWWNQFSSLEMHLRLIELLS